MKQIYKYLFVGLSTALITTAFVFPITALLYNPDKKNIPPLHNPTPKEGDKNSNPEDVQIFGDEDISLYGNKAKINNQKILDSISFKNEESWVNDEMNLEKLWENYKKSMSMENIDRIISAAAGKDVLGAKRIIFSTLQLNDFENYKNYRINDYDTYKTIYKIDYLYSKNNCLYANEISLFCAKKIKKPFNYDEILVFDLTKAVRKHLLIFKFRSIKIQNFNLFRI